MANIIKIKIPEELKQKFKEDKHLFITNTNKEEKIKIIEKALEIDDVVTIERIIDSATEDSPYYNVQKEGFYQEFPLWLNFALLELTKSIGVEINTILEHVDMYAALCYTYDEMQKENIPDDIDLLIDNIINLIIEEKNGINDNLNLTSLCSLFINISKGKLNPEELADISYENFTRNMASKKSNNRLI